VLVAATAAAVVVAGAAVVSEATGVPTGVSGDAGAAVAAVVTGWVVLEVQPANNTVTSSSAQTILRVMRVCDSVLFCIVIVPFPSSIGTGYVKLLSFIFLYVNYY
jgi:hypothetical protein